MRVKVTDPCYVIDTDAWDRLCNEASELEGDKKWTEIFQQLVEDYLQEHTGAKWARAGDTGYGDWSNRMSGAAVLDDEFYADAGMWCVVPAGFNERADMDPNGGAAILEFDDQSYINVEIENDNDGQWTEFSVGGLKNEEYVTNYSEAFNGGEEDA